MDGSAAFTATGFGNSIFGTAEGRLMDIAGRLLAHGTTTCLIFPN